MHNRNLLLSHILNSKWHQVRAEFDGYVRNKIWTQIHDKVGNGAWAQIKDQIEQTYNKL